MATNYREILRLAKLGYSVNVNEKVNQALMKK